MIQSRALYRLHFVHAAFFGYVARARDEGDTTSIIALAQIFCDNQGCKFECESLARTYYDTLQMDRDMKKLKV